MKIVCNGEALEIAPGTRVADYLSQLGLEASSLVVECDGRILTREEYESHALQDGSILELIRFVGGG
jgi:thiamine biosynthesis protein ThiS